MKQERLEARLSPEQASTIAAAARAVGRSRSSFVVEAAVERAERILKHERETRVAWDRAEGFLAWFDRPAEAVSGLALLVDTPVLEHR